VNDDSEITGPVDLPIGPELDLHTFRPREVADVVSSYLDECRERGILEVRIIHGKGIGNLRRTVRALLERRTDVERQAEASAHFGGAGATIVRLRAK
jgi:DNA-nicking Smr family endonuclease